MLAEFWHFLEQGRNALIGVFVGFCFGVFCGRFVEFGWESRGGFGSFWS